MSQYDKLRLTPTEQRLFDAMADGEPHSPDELIQAAMDPDVDRIHLINALCRLRSKLRIIDEDVLCQSFGKYVKYRRIRLLVSDGTSNGKP